MRQEEINISMKIIYSSVEIYEPIIRSTSKSFWGMDMSDTVEEYYRPLEQMNM